MVLCQLLKLAMVSTCSHMYWLVTSAYTENSRNHYHKATYISLLPPPPPNYKPHPYGFSLQNTGVNACIHGPKQRFFVIFHNLALRVKPEVITQYFLGASIEL